MIRILAAAAALLVVAGCSEPAEKGVERPSPEPTTQESTAPEPAASGREITGTDYAYHVPRGWGLPKQKVPGFDPDSMAFDLRDRDRFTDNINVLVAPADAMDLRMLERAARNELRSIGAKDVTVNDRVTVAGSESIHLTALASINDLPYRVEQFYIRHDDRTFVVTFSFSEGVSTSKRAEVTGAVLASWAWADSGSGTGT